MAAPSISQILWASGGGAAKRDPTSKATTGWLGGATPEAPYVEDFNGLLNNITDWLRWVKDEKTADIQNYSNVIEIGTSSASSIEIGRTAATLTLNGSVIEIGRMGSTSLSLGNDGADTVVDGKDITIGNATADSVTIGNGGSDVYILGNVSIPTPIGWSSETITSNTAFTGTPNNVSDFYGTAHLKQRVTSASADAKVFMGVDYFDTSGGVGWVFSRDAATAATYADLYVNGAGGTGALDTRVLRANATGVTVSRISVSGEMVLQTASGPSVSGKTLILKDPTSEHGSIGAKENLSIFSGFHIATDGTVKAVKNGVGLVELDVVPPNDELDAVWKLGTDYTSTQVEGNAVVVTGFGYRHQLYANGSAKFDGLIVGNDFVYNVNTTTLSAYNTKRLANTGLDKNIVICLGDSHSWGEGAPSYEGFYAPEMNGHSSYPESIGYFRRIKNFFEANKDWETRVFRPIRNATTSLDTQRSQNFLEKPVALNGAYLGIQPLVGQYVILAGSVLTPGASNAGWFNPTAIGDAYSPMVYRDRVYRNHFGNDVFYFGPSTITHPNTELLEKEGCINIIPDETVSVPPVGWTHYSQNGGYYGDRADDNSSTLIYTRDSTLPYWAVVNNTAFLHGYGLVKLGSFVALPSGGWSISIRKPDGDPVLTKNPFPCIFPGAKLYNGSMFGDARLRVPLDKAVRSVVLALQLGPDRGKIGIYFTDEGSVLSDGEVGPSSRASVFHSNGWGVKVYQVLDGVDNDITGASTVTITGSKIVIDCYDITPDLDVVLKIDFGMRQKGAMWLSYEGENIAASDFSTFGTPCIALRGFRFDTNFVENWAMGAHTTGAMLGLGASLYGETRDHIGDIITYSPYTPSLLLFEAPIVNEYLAQTNVTTFGNNMLSIIERLNNAKNTGLTRRMDAIVFSTVGGKDVDYEGAVSSPITYDMYCAELLRLSNLGNFVYIDFRKMFKEMVRLGAIEDYNMLYHDSNHPSPFVNEYIAEYLKRILQYVA